MNMMCQVKTKRVSQCVEFYYLSKKLPEQQKKQRERGAEGDVSGMADSSVSLNDRFRVRG